MHELSVKANATIAVVGASVRAATFSLLKTKHEVVAADLFADADLLRQCRATRVSPYPEGFEAWLAQTECDAWLYTGALENYPDLVDRMSVLRPLLGHRGELLRRARDPMQLQINLRHEGFDFPETQLARTARARRGEWISKTYRGSCGSGVGRDDSQFLQRRIEGVTLSAVYLGEQLLDVTQQLVGEKWAGASEFQYCGSIGPYPLSSERTRRLEDLGKTLNATFGLNSLYGVDLIDDGEALWVIEVNPRYTASVEVVERMYGISVFDPNQAISKHGGVGGRAPQGRAVIGGCSPKPPVFSESGTPVETAGTLSSSAPTSHFGKVVMFAKAPLNVGSELSDRLLHQAGEPPRPELADIPCAGTEIENGQPLMTVFAEGESCEGVASRLQSRVTEIEQQLYGRAFLCG